jgi:hypothetical protein
VRLSSSIGRPAEPDGRHGFSGRGGRAQDVVHGQSQSGEKIRGRHNLQALRGHHPGKPSGFLIRRIVGINDLWVTEYVINYATTVVQTVSIMEFQNGKVIHETQYFAEPFEAPAWRSQWVEHGR